MDVSLDCSEDDCASEPVVIVPGGSAQSQLLLSLRLHEGNEVSHGPLHHSGGLYHLGQEHLASTEQPTS